MGFRHGAYCLKRLESWLVEGALIIGSGRIGRHATSCVFSVFTGFLLLFRTAGGEGLIASGRRISSRVRICEQVTMMIMILLMIIMMKTNMMKTGIKSFQ